MIRRLSSFVVALAVLSLGEASACRLAVDALILLENGQPVSAPMSFMIAEEKAAPQNGGWLPCLEGACGKRRDQEPVSGGPNDVVLCVLPGAKPFFSSGEWSTLSDSPAKDCDDNAKRWRCTQALYVKYVQARAKDCRKTVIRLPKGDVGLVPYRKRGAESRGPGDCVLPDRCFQLDVAKKTARPCTRAQLEKRFPAAELTR